MQYEYDIPGWCYYLLPYIVDWAIGQPNKEHVDHCHGDEYVVQPVTRSTEETHEMDQLVASLPIKYLSKLL